MNENIKRKSTELEEMKNKYINEENIIKNKIKDLEEKENLLKEKSDLETEKLNVNSEKLKIERERNDMKLRLESLDAIRMKYATEPVLNGNNYVLPKNDYLSQKNYNFYSLNLLLLHLPLPQYFLSN